MFRPLNPTPVLLATTVMAGFSSAIAPNSPRPVGSVHHGRLTKYDEVCPEVPSLVCKNGSTCAPGVAAFRGHQHLGLPTQDSGYYCKCPDGFIGHECGVRVEDCDVGPQSDPRVWACYHGSSCRSHEGKEYCDCEGLNASSDPADRKFAGAMCQHESTSLCAVSLVGQQSPNHQFCTNHGQCARLVAGDEPHPGCICRDGWMGDHCEISADPFTTTHSRREESGGDAKVEPVTLDVALVFFVVNLGVIGVGVGLVRMAVMRGSEGYKANSFQVEKGASEGEEAGMEAEKTVVGVGDLDPDGSATLGNRAKDQDTDSSGVLPPPTETFAALGNDKDIV